MKKFLVCLVLLCGFNTISFAVMDNKQEVVIDQVGKGEPSPRSAVQKPKVFVDAQMCQLSISFAQPWASYTLYVYDQSGAPIYSDALLTDGDSHIYLLPAMEVGMHVIRIESTQASFEGQFSVL